LIGVPAWPVLITGFGVIPAIFGSGAEVAFTMEASVNRGDTLSSVREGVLMSDATLLRLFAFGRAHCRYLGWGLVLARWHCPAPWFVLGTNPVPLSGARLIIIFPPQPVSDLAVFSAGSKSSRRLRRLALILLALWPSGVERPDCPGMARVFRFGRGTAPRLFRLYASPYCRSVSWSAACWTRRPEVSRYKIRGVVFSSDLIPGLRRVHPAACLASRAARL